MMARDFYMVPEVAEMTGLTAAEVYRRVEAGEIEKLPPGCIEGCVVLDARSVETFVRRERRRRQDDLSA